MGRVERIGDCELHLGDCLEVQPVLEAGSVDAVVTDPPYGMAWKTPVSPRRAKSGRVVVGDDKPFDPTHLLSYPIVVLCGAHHYADKLPASSGWVVWDKRNGMPTNDQSDADLIWTNALRRVLVYRQVWNGGGSLWAENGADISIHPTQKPVALITWLLENVASSSKTVLDPYMGSGTTGVACVKTGRKFIGIEIEPKYFEIACKRIEEAYQQMRLL